RQRATRTNGRSRKVRYAVVGLGFIAQRAVLPAFDRADENSELAALISGDPTKLRRLSRLYGVEHTFSYDEYEEALESGLFDAVYIALPNHLHHRYAVMAARAGKHVLCEKPMAMSQEDCEDMIRAAEENDVRLMVAYRLHFERANLQAIETVTSGEIGDARAFDSLFAMQVKPGGIRLRRETGGGTLWDIGIYCINAARHLFREEPLEVFAYTGTSGESRFEEVEEMCSAVMRFPGSRLATFTVSFGASDVATYTVLGTKGCLCVDNGYEYAEPITHELTIGDRTTEREFKKRDQFAPELVYFSECVQNGRNPEPSGIEGLIDVSIIEALYQSAETMKPVEYQGPVKRRRPTAAQEIFRRPSRERELVHTTSPHQE
ncbi:MAG TPA: Gfo/Idh/MocA family oxidoreductase, partial [Candidatus Eisenbacteria bacterium]|nr:Gfo/Idh/MocA family oxidoreductase [Candidatus Eisenbacteria bacterium]